MIIMATTTMNSSEQSQAIPAHPSPITAPKKYGDTTQYRHRLALEFPGIGIVHDILGEGNSDQSRVDPAYAQHRNQRGNEVQHIKGYLSDGNNQKEPPKRKTVG